MPDLINPTFDNASQVVAPVIPQHVDADWVRPTVNIPASLQENTVSLPEFNQAVTQSATPQITQDKQDEIKAQASVGNNVAIPTLNTSMRYFNSESAMRYKQNDRLWKTLGFNPEVPADVTDAMYDHHETSWESFKNVLPKIWDNTAFAYKNYFDTYVDTAKAISTLDMNALHDDARFQQHINDEKDLENTNPDYKTDASVGWSDYINPFSKRFGDAWESGAGGLGFMIGTIGAAATENAAITLATDGFGELAELPNSARKVYNAINDYYSLKRAYGLVKSFIGAKSVIGGLSSGVDIWRLTNSALSMSAYDGASNSLQYMENFKNNYIKENGRTPDDATLAVAKQAADHIANKTILFETPFLLANNAIQFGNLIAPKTIAGLVERFGAKGAFELAGGGLEDAFQTTVKATEKSYVGRFMGTKVGQVFKHSLIGGVTGEVQTGVRSGVEDYYNNKYFNTDNASVLSSIGAGFHDMGSNEGVKSFAAGFAMGGMFQAIAMPFHLWFKPVLRTPEEQATYIKENPTVDANSTEARYKPKGPVRGAFNDIFNVGMEGPRKEQQRFNLQKVAENLNQNGLEQFLKSDGFLDMVKNKQTALALAKFMQTNDQFNMANAQSLQLNRMLFSGLSNGKIDIQINKLKEFADQPFESLKNYFGLKDEDYATREDQDAFMNSFRGFAAELDAKSSEFKKIYNSEKDNYSTIMSQVAKIHEGHINKINDFTEGLKQKYGVETADELERVVSPEDRKAMAANNVIATRSKLRFYGINEAMKASVFSQAGMKADAKRASDIVGQLRGLDTSGIAYQELGNMFSDSYREQRMNDLNEKVKLGDESNDPNADLYREQRDHFQTLKNHLDSQFGKFTRMDGSRENTFDTDKATQSLQDYLYSIQKETNHLDNNTSLQDRIDSQSEQHKSLLGDWMKLQNKHQENLNLYNYLSNIVNRENYTNFESGKLADFFRDAANLHTEDAQARPDQASEEPAASTTEPTQPAEQQPVAAIEPPVEEEKPVTQEAKDMVAAAEKGVASAVTPNMERIAEENGITVTPSTKPEDIIAALKDKINNEPEQEITPASTEGEAVKELVKALQDKDPETAADVMDKMDYMNHDELLRVARTFIDDPTFADISDALRGAIIDVTGQEAYDQYKTPFTETNPRAQEVDNQPVAGEEEPAVGEATDTTIPADEAVTEQTPTEPSIEDKKADIEDLENDNKALLATKEKAERNKERIAANNLVISILNKGNSNEEYRDLLMQDYVEKRDTLNKLPEGEDKNIKFAFLNRTNDIANDLLLAIESRINPAINEYRESQKKADEERDLNIKKADIERRRQEELKKIEGRRANHLSKFNATGQNTELTDSEAEEAELIINHAIEQKWDVSKLHDTLNRKGYIHDLYNSVTALRSYLEGRLNGSIQTKINGELLNDINTKYDAELAALDNKQEPIDEVKARVDKMISDGILTGMNKIQAEANPRAFLEYIAQQTNNVMDNGEFDIDHDIRTSPSVVNMSQEIKDLANELFPQYAEIANKADQEKTRVLEQTPTPISEIPPTQGDSGGLFVPESGSLGNNPISTLIDQARQQGKFVFDTVNPKEIEKKEEDHIVLKTVSDKLALRQHRMMENFTKIIKNGDSMENFKFKLEIVNEKNIDSFFKRDTNHSNVIAMLTDKNGKYHYITDDGKVGTEDTGSLFGIEYEDTFYTQDRLTESRNSLSGIPSSIQHGFGETTEPLKTIFTLLANKVPVYASVMGVTSGTLSSLNNTNTFNNKERSTYKMRTLKEVFDSGDLDPAFTIAKVDGFYILDYANPRSEQRIKIGRPMVYDVKSNLYLPLTGRKLKDALFGGATITKESQLGEAIDLLDKNGSISSETLRPDKTRVFANDSDILNFAQFMTEMLYSQDYKFDLSSDKKTVSLTRGVDKFGQGNRVGSLWDSEINYIVKSKARLDLPFTADEKGEPTNTSLQYEDFVNDNFLTGAVQAQITPSEKAFTKINKRAMIQLDDTHEDMLKKIGSTVQTMAHSSQEPTVSDMYSSEKDPSKIYRVSEIDEYGMATLINTGNEEDEVKVNKDLLAKKWLRVEKIERHEAPVATDAQAKAHKAVKSAAYIKSTLSVTSIIRPTQIKGENTANQSTVAGNVIDYIAKNIFDGNKVSVSDEIKMNNVTGKVGDYFTNELNFNSAVERITSLKEELEKKGYIFKTSVRVQDAETGLGGEIDLVAISPEGKAMIIDFKTSTSNFDKSHMERQYAGVSEKEYFATQGYIYGLMLEKQTGIPIEGKTAILGMPVAYEGSAVSAYETKIANIRPKKDYLVTFSKGDITKSYRGLSTLKDIVAKYNTLKNQDATVPGTGTIKKKDTGPLLRSIIEIQAQAASNAQLRAEIEDMSRMFGEDMMVKFVNHMNRYAYGEWTTNGTTLYRNAIEGTGYHEGWHQFSQLYLTDKQKQNLYERVRDEGINYTDRAGDKQNTSDHTDFEVEEFLADEWAKYAKDPESYTYPGKKDKGILAFFKRLWDMIKRFFSGERTPTQLFSDLYDGNLGKYEKDINNAMFGNLTSSVIDENGNEVISHIRTSLYKDATSYMVGQILSENQHSFSWLRENASGAKLKDYIYNKFYDLADSRVQKLSVPNDVGLAFTAIENDAAAVIDRTVTEKGITPEMAGMYVNQLSEISRIMDESAGGFNSFIKWYINNTDIDSLKYEEEQDITSIMDDPNVRAIEAEYEAATEEDEVPEEEEEGRGSQGERYGQGPNDTSAFDKASREIKDFFRTMPVIEGINDDGSYQFLTNELDLPLTHDYASVFNKAKTLLAGRFTEDKILNRLSDPLIQKDFPQAQYMYNKLKEYMDNPTPENVSFLARFTNIMRMPEVDNRVITVNFDNVKGLQSEGRTAVRARSLSRRGEQQDIAKWASQFRRPWEGRALTTMSDNISVNDVFNGKDHSNMFYNIEGVVKMNPFYNYASLDTEKSLNTKQFLHMLGVDLNDRFWDNTDLVRFADQLKSFIMRDLVDYGTYMRYRFVMDSGIDPDKFDEITSNPTGNRALVEQLYSSYFLDNPINQFRERRTYSIGSKKMETQSIYTMLADVSNQNSVFSLNSSSRSFTDGSGKTKWPFYNLSLLNYRTQVLNDVNDVDEFNKNPDFVSLNPNTAPWLKNSLFFMRQFYKGKRITVSDQVMDSDTKPYSQEKVRIQLADLSSFEQVTEGQYNRAHPKSLSAQDKFFFDIVSLLSDGYIEVPRAATSSSILAIKLNSYGAKRKGDGFRKQTLPIDSTSSGIFRSNEFRAVMSAYMTGELQKLKYYFDENPNPEDTSKKMDDPSRNYFAHNLNIFKDIVTDDLGKKMIKAAQQTKSMDDIKGIVDENADDFNGAISAYFSNYANQLYSDKQNSNMMAMSDGQKKIVKSLLDLFQDRSKSQAGEDVQRQREIIKTLEEKGQNSAYERSREIAFLGKDASLLNVASVFAANQFILNVEYHNWYMGDNYQFSNPFKRGNLTTNTGDMAIVSDFMNEQLNSQAGETMHNMVTGKTEPKDYRYLRTSTIKDAIFHSKYFDMMVNDILNYEKAFHTEKSPQEWADRKLQLEKDFAAYQAVNSADGQSKIGLDSYRALRKIYGNWSKADENEYKRQLAILRTKKNLYKETGDELEAAKEADKAFIKSGPRRDGSFSEFNPQKFAYTGPEVTKDKEGNIVDTPYRTKFDKTSLHPLLPEVLSGTGLADEDLMMDMAMNDVDYVKFESASKGVKNSDPVPFFGEDGKKIPDVKLEDHKYENLLSSYLKNQLSTDGMKDENIFGSQQRVMFFDVKYQPEAQNNPELLKKITDLENRYLGSVKTIMSFQRGQFLNRFGMEETMKNGIKNVDIVDQNRFKEAVMSIAKEQNFPSNMIEYLKTGDPSLMFNRKMLIDTIGGIIDGDLRRLRTPGTAAIQVTQTGQTQANYTNPTEEDIKKYGTAGLHYYHIIYDDNGKPLRTSTMGVKITLQGDFENLLNLDWRGKKIRNVDTLNKALRDPEFKAEHMDKLTSLAYRIPTNNNNFIDHTEVMEFLPKSAGNIVIAPMEHIIKSGSDFDVDKLNFVFPSIDENGNLISKPELDVKEINEKLNARTSSVIDYKKTEKQKKNLINKAKKDYNSINKLRNQIGEFIVKRLYEINPDLYDRTPQDTPMAELVDKFQPIEDQTVVKQYANYNELSDKLTANGYTLDKLDHEFNNLMKQLSSYKKYHINDMLSVMKETLQQPSYFRMMVSPSNTDYLLEQAKRIGDLAGRSVNDSLSSSENTKYTATNTTYRKFMVDAKALGNYSIQRRWFSLLNYSKMNLNRDWKYGSKGTGMRIYMPLADINQRRELGDSDIINIHGTNLDGKNINDIWDQFMSLTIDLPSNTSYTLFGINNLNKKVVQYLIASRYSVPMIMSLINQPILQEVYDRYENRKKDFASYQLKHAMLEVAKKYGIQGAKFSDMYSKIYELDKDTQTIPIGANVFVENPGLSANTMLSDDLYFTQEELDKDIKSPATSDPDFKTRQKNTLLYFMSANLEATNFSGMQFAFSEDRNKNTNYFTISENNDKKYNVRGDEDNDLPVDGSMFSKRALVKLEKDSIYSPFTYSDVASLFYKQYAKEFTEPVVEHNIKRILDSTSTFGIDRQLLATRIEGDFIEFIYKNFGTFNISTYDPFADKISPVQDGFTQHFVKSIYNISRNDQFRTYEDKLNKMLQLYPELNKISFVNKLSPEGILAKSRESDDYKNDMDGMDATVMRFTRSQDNTIAERNYYISELANLISFHPEEFHLTESYSAEDKQKISAFFTELAYLSLYQSGPTNIADNFSDLLPTTMWEEFSSKAFENYHKNVELGNVSQSDMMKMFSMMYTENNPKVPFRSQRMIYNLTYYGKTLTNETDRKNASRYREDTKFFLNFRAGKFYDLQSFAKDINYTGLKDFDC